MAEVLSIKINPSKLYRALDRASEGVSRELRIEMSKSMRDVAREAKAIHRFKASSKDTAERAIRYDVSPSGLEGRVFLDEQIAPHAKYLHEGTRAHTVKPKSRKSLYWVKGGQKNFSKGHQVSGIVKDQFIYRAMENKKASIITNMKSAVKRAFKLAGF